MKMHGRKVAGPNVEVIVFPRSEGGDLVFKAQAVLDMSGFEKLCPEPVPPLVMFPGGKRGQNIHDQKYIKDLSDHNTLRFNYLIIKSLEATPGLEWETVKIGDSSSWKNYETELKDAGFTSFEIGRLVRCVMIANSLDENKIEEATKSFLASQARPGEQESGQKVEQPTT